MKVKYRGKRIDNKSCFGTKKWDMIRKCVNCEKWEECGDKFLKKEKRIK